MIDKCQNKDTRALYCLTARVKKQIAHFMYAKNLENFGGCIKTKDRFKMWLLHLLHYCINSQILDLLKGKNKK